MCRCSNLLTPRNLELLFIVVAEVGSVGFCGNCCSLCLLSQLTATAGGSLLLLLTDRVASVSRSAVLRRRLPGFSSFFTIISSISYNKSSDSCFPLLSFNLWLLFLWLLELEGRMVWSIYITCVLVLDLCCFVFCCHNCIILENKANDDIGASKQISISMSVLCLVTPKIQKSYGSMWFWTCSYGRFGAAAAACQ